MNTEETTPVRNEAHSAPNRGSSGHFEPIVPPPRKPYLAEYCHKTFGKPSTVHIYTNVIGQLVGYVCRWDVTKGGERGKEMRPLRYGTLDGHTAFHWKGWSGDSQRPLYGLSNLTRLAAGAPVIIVEGEKTADAAAKFFPQSAVLSPMNGAQSPHLSDFAPLNGREVTIWPDHDPAGTEFARAVAKLALKADAKSVRIVKMPAHFPEKWDLADPMPPGCDINVLESLINDAPRFRNVDADGPDMSIVMRVRRSPPVFPTTVFGTLEAVIKAQAGSTSSPIDYTATATLVVAAAVIGNARSVSPWENWEEPACLWAAVIGTPSSGKSPALSPLLTAVRTMEADGAPQFAEDHRRWETEAQAAKQIRELWESQVKKAIKDGSEVPDCPPGAGEPAAPARPRIVVSDTTPEALANLLAGLPRGLLSYRDELSGWLGSFDRYTTSQTERPFWLEAFGGRSFTVDRVKHPLPILISHLLISVLGGIQPDKLASLLLSGDDDGFCARMLMVWPEPVPPRRPTVKANPTVMLACLRRLRSLGMVCDGNGSHHPMVLPLTSEAADWFDQWRTGHYDATLDVPGMLGGHLGKYPGIILRLALVLEHLWWSATSTVEAPKSVSLAAVSAAGRLLDDYFRPMAQCVYGDAAMPEIERRETVLAHWILKTKPSLINARELRREVHLPGLRDAKEVNETLAALVEAGWLTKTPTRNGGGHGRQRSDYEVNHRVYLAVN